MTEATEFIPLLECYYDEFYKPIHWEVSTKKCRNYFARISKGTRSIFNRKFINSSNLDNEVVFRLKNFSEGDIIEQKTVFVKGSKEETTFHGFFIVHHQDGSICGEKISQKDALEFFDCKEMLPEMNQSVKNNLRVKIGTTIRKLTQKYGDEMISEILTDILEEYFPNV